MIGDKPMILSYAYAQTLLGWMLVATSNRGICFLQFADDRGALLGALVDEFPAAILHEMADHGRPDFDQSIMAINECIAGKPRVKMIPLDLCGTIFQKTVWDYLQTIPVGKTQSYQQVAAAIGQPKAVRAVASACARNPVGVLVPCHRVLRGNGDLAGYRWGIERKQQLLTAEKQI